MMRLRDARRALTLALLGLACAAPGSESTEAPPLDPNATLLRVEVYRGLVGGELGPREDHLIVDVTTALGELEPPPVGSDLSDHAREIVGAKLAGVGGARPALHAFHRGSRVDGDYACEGSGSEPFAARALAALERELGPRAAGAYVELYSELDDECIPDFCSAAQSLVTAGAWLDVVLIGEDEAPACLATLEPSTGPVDVLEALRPAAPAFRVEVLAPDGGSAGVLIRGKAGEPAVTVSPGMYNVVVEVDPEEQIGPIRFEAGQSLLATLMDFPLSAPDRRRWKVEVLDETR